MKRITTLLATLLACALYGAPALADKACSLNDVAGSWVFATGIGQQNLPIPPANGDITAIGTMNIARDGSLRGTFDATIFQDQFLEDIPYWGAITVNADCTGTIQFTTPISSRTDSIVIVDRREMIGMSRDPLNLWTYQVRRLQGHRDED